MRTRRGCSSTWTKLRGDRTLSTYAQAFHRQESIRAGRLTYTAVFEPAAEGGYVVTVPALPGCITQADTLTQARTMAAEAILGYLEALQKLGEDIPHEHAAAITRRIAVKLSPA